MADAPDHDEDFHPAKRGDNPIWLGGMKYVRADVAEAEKQLAVAAALREAADVLRRRDDIAPNEMDDYDRGWSRALQTAAPAILAMIDPDARAALDRALAAERERCAKVADNRHIQWATGKGRNPADYSSEASIIAAAIRHGSAISAQGGKT